MPINNRKNCLYRKNLRNIVSQLISLRTGHLSDEERDSILYNLHNNIEYFTIKTSENDYCKPSLSNVNEHFDKLLEHLYDIMNTINQSANEFRKINIISATEYANIIELNIAEFIFFWIKHSKKLSRRTNEAYMLMLKIGASLNDIIFNLPNEEIKDIFYQVSIFVFHLIERLANLVSKVEKSNIFSSNNSLCSNNSSNSSNNSAKSTNKDNINNSKLNLAINLGESLASKSIGSGAVKGALNSGLVGLGFSLAMAVGRDLFDKVKHGKKKDILDLSNLDITDMSPNMKGYEINLSVNKSCIALIVFHKIMQNISTEVQKRLEMEDGNSESYMLWRESLNQINKLRQDTSSDFECKCYVKE